LWRHGEDREMRVKVITVVQRRKLEFRKRVI
jgi:hypothetical protein